LWLDLASGSGTYDFSSFTYQYFSRWEAVKGLVDLEPYVSNPAFPPIDLSKHVPACLETYAKYKGTLYGIPTLADAMIYVYNLDHFAAAGLDPEDPPATWEELYDYCKKMTAGEQYGFALMGGRTEQASATFTCVFAGLARKGWYNDDGTLAWGSEEGLQAMKIMAEWLTEVSPPAASAWNISDANNAVAQAICSSEIQWPGMMPGLLNPENSKVVGKLGFSAPPQGTALGGHAFGVLSSSHNKDAAYLLVEYLTSPEIQREWVDEGYAITITELFEDPEIQALSPWLKATGDALAVGVGFPTEEDTSEVWAICDQYINAAITKEMTPEDALNAMTEEVNALRKEGGYIS
ncbi:MAG: extracellular solute-binding protein, partial [Anaerolineales bacterium]|nr:extracellular solute-binding protein [Anaerolineales bacterium]